MKVSRALLLQAALLAAVFVLPPRTRFGSMCQIAHAEQVASEADEFDEFEWEEEDVLEAEDALEEEEEEEEDIDSDADSEEDESGLDDQGEQDSEADARQEENWENQDETEDDSGFYYSIGSSEKKFKFAKSLSRPRRNSIQATNGTGGSRNPILQELRERSDERFIVVNDNEYKKYVLKSNYEGPGERGYISYVLFTSDTDCNTCRYTRVQFEAAATNHWEDVQARNAVE